jgi:hypothetical protein
MVQAGDEPCTLDLQDVEAHRRAGVQNTATRLLSNPDTVVCKLTRYDSCFENQFPDAGVTPYSIRDMALIGLLAYHTTHRGRPQIGFVEPPRMRLNRTK